MTTKTKSETTVKVKKIAPHTAKLVTEAITLRAQALEMFKQASQIEDELLDRLPHNTPMALADGRVVTLVDKFATKTEIWKATPVRRFELKVAGEKTE